MHEHSLMKNFMDQILELAARENASEVKKISVRLGALSHMSGEHFTGHFNEVARATIAEHAQLDITEDQDINAEDAQGIWIDSVEIEAL